MVLARRKRKGNISMGKLPPPVGFQIMPASAGGGTNAAAMRPTYAFLATDADQLAKRIYTAKAAFLSANQSKSEDDFAGIDDPYGRGIKIGEGKNVIAAEAQARKEADCVNKGGRMWNNRSKQCECPDGYTAASRDTPCYKSIDKDRASNIPHGGK
jgi:hypothetical protein